MSDSQSDKDSIVVEERFDFEKYLRDKPSSKHEARTLGVAFEDLRVVGLGATASYQPTIGSLLNPFNKGEAIKAKRHPPVRDILNGFEGVVRPGEMLLVLGSPGSGCSTLLKTLTNQTSEYHAIHGSVHYDSISPAEIEKHRRGDVTYCPEDDVHFPTLSVEQTIEFADRARAGVNEESAKDGWSEALLTVFGLRHVRGTVVGNNAIRGVSGGEKKRTSIAEALAVRGIIGAWDNSTRGLDASTALEFVQALRSLTSSPTSQLTTIVTLYQASELLYNLFDKVCVVYDGKMAYFGPAKEARRYFEDQGWVVGAAGRQTTADFLVGCTDPLARVAKANMAKPPPRIAEEFAENFKASAIGQRNRGDVDSYLAEHSATSTLTKQRKSVYTMSIPQQIRVVMKRRAQILWGNKAGQVTQTVSFIIQGIIMGTVFLRISHTTAAYFSRGGVLFFSLLFSALTAMAEIPTLFAQRPIVLRHKNGALYHPFVEAFALTLVDVPITFATLLIFSTIIYEAVKLQQSAAQFFTFFVFLFVMNITMKSFFRMLASIVKAQAPAQALAGISIMIMSLYTGYSIPKPSMIGALRWITYINPIRYGFEAILTNEFYTLNGACSTLVPRGAGYEGVSLDNQVCTTEGSVAGQPTVNGEIFVQESYGYYHENVWRNFGIVVSFMTFFVIMLLVFTERNTSLFAGGASITLYKRGSKPSAINDQTSSDEEKSLAETKTESRCVESVAETQARKKALAEAPNMTDVFSWQHINYTVPVGHGDKRRLLDDISGYVVPGKLTALMGESGAGKTTLLNVLAQRVDVGVVGGERLVNGQALPDDFQAQTGYCQQMDTHVPQTTVREALLFSAKLRQPASVPVSEKEAYVETCLHMCGLEAKADAMVGSLDVEFRKRTTIGVELAAKPRLLLFLDEPTSGLDSQSAWAIVSFLRSLADNGTAVLCTIHQPSAELFEVFDRLLLLRKGGQTVYFGDIGHNATTLIHYFETNGSRQCSPEENPAEFMLDVIGAGATAAKVQDWNRIWIESKEATEVHVEIDRIHDEGLQRPAVDIAHHNQFASSWRVQLVELTKRAALRHYRDPTYLMAKLSLNIMSGLLIGFTFFKAKNTVAGTQNHLFSIFMATIVSVPLSNQLQIPFLAMRNVYEIRERPSRMFSWTAMITSLVVTELPWNILGSSIFYLCWFWTVGFGNSRAGFTYLMLGLVFPAYYTTIGIAVAAMAPNAELAGILFSLLFSFVLIFNGVLQPYRELGWWQWMNRLSPYTYHIEAMVGQAVGHRNVTCAPVEIVHLNPPSGQTCEGYMGKYISEMGGYLINPNDSSDCGLCSVRTTDQFLENNFNIFYDHHWRNFGLMLAYIVFNLTCIYVFTYFFRIRTGSILGSIKKRLTRPKATQ